MNGISLRQIKEFKELVYKAMGKNTPSMFYETHRINPIFMAKFFNGKVYTIPHESVLEKIANGSEGRVTLRELRNIFIANELNAVNTIYRGQIWYVDLGESIGSEQGGMRPCTIIQNNLGNKYAPTVIIAPITNAVHNKSNIPTHVNIGTYCGLNTESIVLLEQIRTVDKRRLKTYIGDCNKKDMIKINKAYKISGGVYSEYDKINDIIEESEIQDNKNNDILSAIFNFKNITKSFLNFYKEKTFVKA